MAPADVTAIVLGQAGIGKTTLTREVGAKADRFGARRWFVELETAPDAAGLRERIIVALGLNPAEPHRVRPGLCRPRHGTRAAGARQSRDALGTRHGRGGSRAAAPWRNPRAEPARLAARQRRTGRPGV